MLTASSQVFNFMSTAIRQDHYWTEELTDVDREKLSQVFYERVKDNVTLRAQGIKRVDFLRRYVIFEGLTRRGDGMWELRVRKV